MSEPVKHPMTFGLVSRATAYRNAARNGLQNTPAWALEQCELSLVAQQLDDAAAELDRLAGIERDLLADADAIRDVRV